MIGAMVVNPPSRPSDGSGRPSRHRQQLLGQASRGIRPGQRPGGLTDPSPMPVVQQRGGLGHQPVSVELGVAAP